MPIEQGGETIWTLNFNDGLDWSKIVEGGANIDVADEGVYWKVLHGDEPEPVRGDFDGDGIVTSDDAVYLLRHTLFDWIYPAYGYRDFDRDGRITSDDAVYLLRHTLFPDAYSID